MARTSTSLARTAAAAALALSVSACGSPGGSAPVALLPGSANAAPLALAPHAKIVVRPGGSIQAAIDGAHPGDTIAVEPGKYKEKGRPCPFDTDQTCAIVITTDKLALTAIGGARSVAIVNTGGLTNGIGVGKKYGCEKAASYHTVDIKILGFTVNGFKGSGIVLSCVDNFELAYNETDNNVLYGLYPVFSSNGRVHHNIASFSTDTGIYVGLSANMRVDHNVSYENVSGYEFENTIDSKMDHNTATHNTAGILEFIIPGDPLERSYNNEITDNVVLNNNAPNKCSVPSDDVCEVPPGTGIVVAGGKNELVQGNTVAGHITYGIGVADTCTAFNLQPSECSKLPFNPLPENVRVIQNTVRLNALDLIWTGNGKGNCWLKNKANTRLPKQLPQCS